MRYVDYLYETTLPIPLAPPPKQAAETAPELDNPPLEIAMKVWRSVKIKVRDGNLIGTKVHLWNDYADGKRPTSGTWKVFAHYRAHFENTSFEVLDLNYPFNHSMALKTRGQVCTEAEYEAWVAELNTASVGAESKAA